MPEPSGTPPIVAKKRGWKKIGCIFVLALFIVVLGVGVCVAVFTEGGRQDTAEQEARDPIEAVEREAAEDAAEQAEQDEESVPEPAIEVDARTLYADYEANDIAAGDKYEDKEVIVSGVIASVGRDILDDPYVALETGNPIGSVQCMLADEEKDKAAGLAKGEGVRLRGRVDGKLLNVLVRECVIL